jgi:hypothetical protein
MGRTDNLRLGTEDRQRKTIIDHNLPKSVNLTSKNIRRRFNNFVNTLQVGFPKICDMTLKGTLHFTRV